MGGNNSTCNTGNYWGFHSPIHFLIMDFFSSITTLPLVGPHYKNLLELLEIYAIRDLLYHFPSRYEDYSTIKTISNLIVNDKVTVKGEVAEIKNIYTGGYSKLTTLKLIDSTGSVACIFFNQQFLTRTIKKGMTIQIAGDVTAYKGKPSFVSPDYEMIESESYIPIHTGRLVPIYPETARVSSKWLRKKISLVLNTQQFNDLDLLPLNLSDLKDLNDLSHALRQIHFPKDLHEVALATNRFAFEELFTTQLLGLVKKQQWQSRGLAKKMRVAGNDLLNFITSLPFELTKAQLRVCGEVLEDLTKDLPANRLIQGDVGSGKTVVATLAMYIAYKSGVGSVFMAPTEILAQQHYNTIKVIFEKLFSIAPISLITHHFKSKNTPNTPSILIGTHALLYNPSLYKNIGLVVIDEQHKFGVAQRNKILSFVTAKHTPHILTMTATPIPRSLCLTLFGDLEISTIDEMPKGRLPVKTFVVPESKRGRGYQWIKEKIVKENEQVYVVCPFVEESQVETLKSVRSATAHFEELKSQWFNDIPMGLIHGRLKSKEKEEIITEFRDGTIKILVATSVVEVGMDIPNANIMVIEGAERFGLASLHQLRGRVGRSSRQAYCFLFTTEGKSKNSRLSIMEKSQSGLVLAQKDMETRGPGELYGIKQSGKSKFRFANFSDEKLLEQTYKTAVFVSQNLDKYPQTVALLKKLSPDTIGVN